MFHSVRARLTLWYTAILALVLITFSAVSYVLLSRAIHAQNDASLTDAADDFIAAFNPASRGTDYRNGDREIFVLPPGGRIIADAQTKIGAAERQRIEDFVRAGGNGLHTIAGGEEGDGVRIVSKAPPTRSSSAFRSRSWSRRRAGICWRRRASRR
jgi:hypothetical protein